MGKVIGAGWIEAVVTVCDLWFLELKLGSASNSAADALLILVPKLDQLSEIW